MDITLLSSVSGNSSVIKYEKELISELTNSDHHLKHFDLNSLSIHSCTGCWSCWVKTPGCCIFNDDMPSLLSAIINSDLLIYLAEPVLGYVNHRTKIVMDRSIPLVHPYIELVDGECHHKMRYQKYPQLGLILEDSGDLEKEDLEIIEHLFSRFALNFKSELKIFTTTSCSVEEVINEINNN